MTVDLDLAFPMDLDLELEDFEPGFKRTGITKGEYVLENTTSNLSFKFINVAAAEMIYGLKMDATLQSRPKAIRGRESTARFFST